MRRNLYNAEKNLIKFLLYESSKVVAELEVDLSNGIREFYFDSYEDKRLGMDLTENLTEGNSTSNIQHSTSDTVWCRLS